MTATKPWDRQDLLIAFSLYTELAFGQLHQRNKKIIQYAAWMGRTPASLAMKLVNLASLDPVITSTGRVGLKGASKADRAMWQEMHTNWLLFSRDMHDAVLALRTLAPPSEAKGETGSWPELQESAAPDYSGPDHSGKMRAAHVQVRIGQGYFRRAVLSAYNYRCCISGLAVPELLIASHIVPWQQDTQQRLNPQNGLALSSLHDKAFDSGLLTIDQDFRVVVSQKVGSEQDEFFQRALQRFHGKTIEKPQKFGLQAEFLAWHQQHVFEKKMQAFGT